MTTRKHSDRSLDKIMTLGEIAEFTHREKSTVRKWFINGQLRRIPRLGASCWLSDLIRFLDNEDSSTAARLEGQQRRAEHARASRRLEFKEEPEAA